MRRLTVALLYGIMVTCAVDSERDVREVYQVKDLVMFSNGCIQFEDVKGNRERVCSDFCVVEEGTVPPIGTDMRPPEQAPTVPLDVSDEVGRR